MRPLDVGKATANAARPTEFVAGDSGWRRSLSISTHAALLSNECPVIEAYLSVECRAACFDPLHTFVVVVDLRGDFGRRLGLHLLDRVTLDRRIRRALADGVLPSLSVPMALDHGVAVVELLAPEWLAWLDERPSMSVPILVVNAEDVGRLAFGRLRDGHFH